MRELQNRIKLFDRLANITAGAGRFFDLFKLRFPVGFQCRQLAARGESSRTRRLQRKLAGALANYPINKSEMRSDEAGANKLSDENIDYRRN